MAACAALAASLAVPGVVAARADRVTICHATGSTTRPIVMITVARTSLDLGEYDNGGHLDAEVAGASGCGGGGGGDNGGGGGDNGGGGTGGGTTSVRPGGTGNVFPVVLRPAGGVAGDIGAPDTATLGAFLARSGGAKTLGLGMIAIAFLGTALLVLFGGLAARRREAFDRE